MRPRTRWGPGKALADPTRPELGLQRAPSARHRPEAPSCAVGWPGISEGKLPILYLEIKKLCSLFICLRATCPQDTVLSDTITRSDSHSRTALPRRWGSYRPLASGTKGRAESLGAGEGCLLCTETPSPSPQVVRGRNSNGKVSYSFTEQLWC